MGQKFGDDGHDQRGPQSGGAEALMRQIYPLCHSHPHRTCSPGRRNAQIQRPSHITTRRSGWYDMVEVRDVVTYRSTTEDSMYPHRPLNADGEHEPIVELAME